MQKEVCCPEPRGTQPPQIIIDRISQIYERPIVARVVIATIGFIGNAVLLDEIRDWGMKGFYVGIVFNKRPIIQDKFSRKIRKIYKDDQACHKKVWPKLQIFFLLCRQHEVSVIILCMVQGKYVETLLSGDINFFFRNLYNTLL